MGAQGFNEYENGTDVDQAFRAAHTRATEEAEDDGVSADRSGTLATKDSYKIVTPTGMPLKEAEGLADKLLGGPDDGFWKWDPAGAIPVLAESTAEIEGWVFFGWAAV
ncbi:hypothetical protein AQJ46_47040 [Streptomyces canus]|uniref:Uncharacterized protein n=1 Tax=Streptomyces canus TaxID=58343 RepID=A0A101RL50_9ACTN|nr:MULTISPECIES: hypothetical protein [Streptomyces]KUN57624.1 hypothetical protein AQJ46_47040 [Streptomyces canus]MDH6522497.1 hypothetical protein [Streptomyces sp. SAI-090]